MGPKTLATFNYPDFLTSLQVIYSPGLFFLFPNV